MSKFLQIPAVMRDVTKQDTYVTKQDTILDLNHLNLGVWLKMGQNLTLSHRLVISYLRDH